MPLYFFHRTDGAFERDQDGTELPNLQTAKNRAVLFAGETLRDSPDMVWPGENLRIEVTDRNDLILFTVVITALDSVP